MCLGIPGKIISIELSSAEAPESSLAKVDFSGVTQNVRLDFVPEAKVGNFVLVHVGVALSVIDEDEALQTLQLLSDLGEFYNANDR
ncbi:MAG: HypC/HybG/HupF family hydrogenase formation chaperone [Bdellovibrionaceae bacterium]|nr:HypC/HybG/HupF family hydrogenase formation chaperone [Pseudobdellovibrionaceae bacterium]